MLLQDSILTQCEQVPPASKGKAATVSSRALGWSIRQGGGNHGHGADHEADVVTSYGLSFREVRCSASCPGPDPVRLVAGTVPAGQGMLADWVSEEDGAAEGAPSPKPAYAGKEGVCATFVLVTPGLKQR